MSNRVYNFFAGPATLPLEVVREATEGSLEFKGLGMSVMEISHRSTEFDAMFRETQKNMLDIMGLSENEYAVLFLGGGASSQFLMIPYNFLTKDRTADYINTGTWSKKAIKEAKMFGSVNVAASSADAGFKFIPPASDLTPGAAYVHTTSNNTVAGTQMFNFPETGNVPLVSDMSSDFLSRKLDFSKFSLIYAGAQKNIGPSGVTAVIVKKSWVEKANDDIPTMMSYKTHVSKNSMFNTPPSFPIYVVGLVMKWILDKGGIEGIEKTNDLKAQILYDAIDNSDGYYTGIVEKDSRSKMNVTFKLPTEELEKKFVADGVSKGLLGLKGHRSVGGCRASIYNAMPLEGVESLIKFMKEFK